VTIGTNPRLSSVLLNTDESTEGNVNSATTLAAERWGPELLEGDITEEELNETLATATELLEGSSGEELDYILDGLVADEFGSGFPADLPHPLQTIANQLNGVDLSVCEDLELETEISAPLKYIEVYGVAEELGNEPGVWIYDAEIEEPSEDDQRLIYMERTTGQEAKLLAPFHPTNWREGGNVKVVVFKEDTSLTCPALDLEVGPLEPAPGTRKEMVDELENNVRLTAENLGYDPDVLLEANIKELDPLIMGTAGLLQIIDGPNNPNNLRNLLSGEAPIYDGQTINEETEEIYDAIYAKIGFDDFVKNISSDFKELTTQFNGESPFGETVSKQSNVRQDIEIGVQPKNVTPGELDLLMSTQSVYESLNTGFTGEAHEFAGILAGTTSLTVGLVPGAQVLAAQIGAAGNILTYQGIALSLGQNILPSQLQDIEITLSHEVYNEDQGEVGEWEADLAAHTEDWTLEWDQALGGLPFLGSALKVISRISTNQMRNLVLELSSGIFEELWKVDTDSGPVTIEEFVVNVEGGIDPNRQNEESYFSWKLETEQSETGEDPIILLSDESTYEPQAVGVSNLRVRTEPGVFDGQFRESIEPIEVLPIEIEIIGPDGGSSPFSVDPGEEIGLFAEVENANDPSVEWSTSEGFFSEITGEHDQEALYAAPDAKGSYTVTATSVAETGARADGDPERSGSAKVVVGEFNVTPDRACVQLDENVEFTALIGDEEIPFSEVNVSMSGPGSIGSDGVFVPVEEGEVTIEFRYETSEVTEPQTVVVEFLVREFCSYFDVKTDTFDHTSYCVFGYSETGTIVNQYLPNESVLLQIMDTGTSTGGDGWISQEGEWEVEVTGLLQEEFNIGFELEEGDVQWFGSTWKWVDGVPEPVGSQTLTVRREIKEIGGQEVALFSGSFSGMVFHPPVGDERITGSGDFRNVPDFEHDPPPPEDWLNEWICQEQ
jgi:hypothetical protein